MWNRGVCPLRPIFIDRRRRVYIGARFDESLGGIQVAVFGGHVEQRNTDERGKRTLQARAVLKKRWGCPDGSPDRVGVVQEHRRDGWIGEHGPAGKKQSQAICESVGSRVFLEQPQDRQLAPNR